MLFRVQYRQGLAHRYVRADDAHDARNVARDTWGMTKVIPCKAQFVSSNYGAAGYDACVNTASKVIDTKFAAAESYAFAVTRDERMRSYQAKKTARNVAQQNIVISI